MLLRIHADFWLTGFEVKPHFVSQLVFSIIPKDLLKIIAFWIFRVMGAFELL